MPTSIDVFAKAREHERLEQLRAARELGVFPYFHVLEGPTLPVVEMEGKRRIMLGSNNYLGLTNDARVNGGNAVPAHGKDAFHDFVIHGNRDAVNPQQSGTKAAVHHVLTVPAGGHVACRLRLCAGANAQPWHYIVVTDADVRMDQPDEKPGALERTQDEARDPE